jgi:hypothetical protein
MITATTKIERMSDSLIVKYVPFYGQSTEQRKLFLHYLQSTTVELDAILPAILDRAFRGEL